MTQTANKAKKRTGSRDRYHYYPFWSPRFWHGMLISDYLRMMTRNRFAVHPARLGMAIILIFICAGNSVLGFLQRLIYGRALAETKIENEPVFIIGHWRSGTTFLHELFVRDDRFTFPTTYECFTPHHSLLTGWFMTKWMGFLLPSKRPMDNVKTGFAHPQEDEFALVALGVPSPYLSMAFPNRPPQYFEYLDMADLNEQELSSWKSAFRRFLTMITYRGKSKPIVLKSPTHTGRIGMLAAMFPKAKFVHIVRDPYVVYPSTVRLWKSLFIAQGFQSPRCEGIEEYVLSAFEQMYASFERGRKDVEPDRIVDIRYDDLVQDPVEQMRQIYEELSLPDFEKARPALEQFASEQRDYRTNQYDLDPDIRDQITRRWMPFMEKYGFAPIESQQELPS